jgi:hypothetical protein
VIRVCISRRPAPHKDDAPFPRHQPKRRLRSPEAEQLPHHRSGGDDGALADLGAVERRRIRADPDIVADPDSAFGAQETLLGDWDFAAMIGIGSQDDLHARRQRHVVAEADSAAAIERM